MLLMLKSLVIALLLSSSLQANVTDKQVEDFLKKSFSGNKGIKSLKINVVSKVDVESMKGWQGLIVDINAVLKKDNRKVNQKMVWFTNGNVMTQDLIDLKTGDSLKDKISPTFQASYYKKSNLIYGNANAKHKVAIFSDPLCPFCRNFVPKAISHMKKYPNKFAIYYYHFPLPSLHPAAVELVKASYVAEAKGKKDVVLSLYKVKMDNARERNVSKILKAFNKELGTNISPSDIKSDSVMKHFKSDMDIASKLMVQGTPTMYFDGKLDKSKKKYLKVK